MPGSFFDSNILLYLATSEAAKADRVDVLLIDGGTISVQVLNEIADVARRKMRMSWPDTRKFLGMIRDVLPVRPITVEVHDRGVALAERYGLSVYDAMILASVLDTDCDLVWSEDMQDGMVIDGRLRIVDPFTP